MKKWIPGLLKAVLIVSIVLSDTTNPGAQGVRMSATWIGTWSVSPSITDDGGFHNQTLRQIVHTSIGGKSPIERVHNLPRNYN